MKIPTKIQAWAARQPNAALEQIELPIPELSPTEALIEVLACGICHSDVHLIDDDWRISQYPLVPGHEIVGRVVAMGREARGLEPGMLVGVGWQRTSCGACEDCVAGDENLCGTRLATCVAHPGGYADYHVTDARFAFPLPGAKFDPAVAPLLCGGATVFGPLCDLIQGRHARTPSLGVVGLGGLGHLAVKLGAALGMRVTVFSSSPRKREEALALGAEQFIGSAAPEAIESVGPSLDMVLVTAPADLPWTAFLHTLRSDGTLCFVGIPPGPISMPVSELLARRLRITASPIGSRARIGQMLEYCRARKITADIEAFPLESANEALRRVRENKVRHRAVLVRG